MTKHDRQDTLPVAQGTNALAAAVRGAVGGLSDRDYEDAETERAPLTYLSLRQKDLKDGGKTVRDAGGFRVGKATNFTHEDREELSVTILAFAPGRVYFKTLQDTKPVCRSEDGIAGSAPETVVDGKRVFGKCSTCWYSQWGSAEGGRQKCRENRRILVMDWASERPSVVTIGPSSLTPFAEYVKDFEFALREYRDQKGRMPFLHHLFMVKLRPTYRAEPAGHYVVEFGKPEALPLTLQDAMTAARTEAKANLRAAAEAQEYEAGDFVGSREPGEE